MAVRFGDLLHRLRGFSTPIGGVSWNSPQNDREIAQRLMTFLYDRRVLHAPSEAESPRHVVASVLEIRKELTDLAKQSASRSKLELKLRGMRGACVHFLNRVQKDEAIVQYGASPGHWASWEFIDNLGQWRAFMAVYIGMIASAYEVDPPAFLLRMLPEIPPPDRNAEHPREEKLSALIDRFAALPFAERQRQIQVTNQYLASAEGRREFGHLLIEETTAKVSEQGLSQ